MLAQVWRSENIMTSDQMTRLGELHRETLEEWTARFLRERGLPELSDAEMREVLRLGRADEDARHQ